MPYFLTIFPAGWDYKTVLKPSGKVTMQKYLFRLEKILPS